ncbi:MAG: DUF2279 domain-containing protein [Sphingomonas fennica]
MPSSFRNNRLALAAAALFATPAVAATPALIDSGYSLPPGGAEPMAGPEPRALTEPADRLPPDPARYRTFGAQFRTVRTEMVALTAYMTAINAIKAERIGAFHFKKEGWFGRSTENVGVDKLTHAFNTYVLAEFLQTRIARRTGGADRNALTAALLASGLMAYSEVWDAVKPSSGWSMEDIVMNSAGALFSVARNTVPGMEEKLDFRLLLVPNSEVYSFGGRKHYAQQRYLMAVKLAGFAGLERTPLRYVELHGGYYAKDFLDEDRERGIVPKRRLFVGVGLNLQEALFPRPRTGVQRAAREALNYLQVPYTAVHVH